MSLLTLTQDAAAELKQPSTFTSVVGNSNANVKLLLALANAEINECRREKEYWPILTKECSFTLLESQSAYAFPADYDCLLRDTGIDASRPFPLSGPVTPQEYSAGQYLPTAAPLNTYFMTEGFATNRFKVLPVPGLSDAGRVLHFRYQTKTCALPVAWTQSTAFGPGSYCSRNGNIYKTTSGGTTGSNPPVHNAINSVSDGGVTWTYTDTAYTRFLADSDESVFGDEVTKLGLIWRWLKANDFDYNAAWQQWKAAVDNLFVNQRGSRTIILGGRSGFQFISSAQIPYFNIGS
jgi:hypothetical protein